MTYHRRMLPLPATPTRIGMLAVLALCLALTLPATASANAYKWAEPSMRYSANHRLIPQHVLAKPGMKMTRRGYVRALVALERRRYELYGTPRQITSVTTGARLADVPETSIYARAVKLGWITPIDGKFAGGRRITADEASLGAVGALGLRPSSRTFASKLKKSAPGLRTRFQYKAAHVYTRALGLRYNHLSGSEELEVGPREAMSVAHVAYLVHRAAIAEEWRLSSVRGYEEFSMPALGANQRTAIYTGIRLIGQPYVWGGTTEGRQPQGHGGFDCSGFVWRVILNSGIPESARYPLKARTSMDMSSEIPRSRRIYNPANLKPGDLMFFGDKGRSSTPAQNFHASVYMGNGWVIHSTGSSDGVTIMKHDGWWRERYSWGRRVLRTY